MADSKKIDDGGPAFAGGLFEPQHGGTNDREPWNPGMTLRDWFAGQAIGSIPLRSWDHLGSDDMVRIEAWAKCSYLIADAMIAARKAGG